jgi:small-conductance mechanosensitive channel
MRSTVVLSTAQPLNTLLEVVQDQWITLVAVLGGALLVFIVLLWLARRFAARTDTVIDNAFVRRIARPVLALLPLIAVQFLLPALGDLDEDVRTIIRNIVNVAMIGAVVWLINACIRGGADLIKARYDMSVSDNYAARRMHTQVNVISRVLVVLVTIIGLALALMTFPSVRELGTSLLASAGIVGIIVGFAARPVLENLIAGVQLALTQPISIDDVVIVDGEWGRIEQITSTYVVVRIWDDRRLICPFGKFISDSFQNWTRRTADILGTVFIHADYTVPVDAVRAELKRIVDGHEKWDGRVCVLQVTDAAAATVQLRALVSSGNASANWDLRVYVREKLIEYLQREHPQCLPRTRIAMHDES